GGRVATEGSGQGSRGVVEHVVEVEAAAVRRGVATDGGANHVERGVILQPVDGHAATFVRCGVGGGLEAPGHVDDGAVLRAVEVRAAAVTGAGVGVEVGAQVQDGIVLRPANVDA